MIESPLHRFRLVLFVAVAAVILAACSDSPTDPLLPDDDEVLVTSQEIQQILFADSESATAGLLALENDETVETFSLHGPATYVYASSSGRFGVLQ